MKLHWIAVLLLIAATLSAIAQDTRPNGSTPAPSESGKEASVAKTRQPGPEMQKLFNAFLGTWAVTEQIEPSETMPNGGTAEGEEVYRTGPGGVSIIEEIHLKEPSGEIFGLGVGWWDKKARGYRALWCDSENPAGCLLMAHWKAINSFSATSSKGRERSSTLRKSFLILRRPLLRRRFTKAK